MMDGVTPADRWAEFERRAVNDPVLQRALALYQRGEYSREEAAVTAALALSSLLASRAAADIRRRSWVEGMLAETERQRARVRRALVVAIVGGLALLAAVLWRIWNILPDA